MTEGGAMNSGGCVCLSLSPLSLSYLFFTHLLVHIVIAASFVVDDNYK